MSDRNGDRASSDFIALNERDVRLRSIIEADFPALIEIRSDHDAQHMLMAHPSTDSLDFEQWIARRRQRPDEIFLVISHARSDETLGFLQITGIHSLDRYGFLGIAISRKHRGRKIGTASMVALLEYLKSTEKIQKLCLYVRSDNVIARELYLKIGFRDVGTLQQHYFDDNQWHDAVLSELFI